MPRRSAAALSLCVVTPLPMRKRPDPPAGISARQKALWREIVRSKSPDWFDAGSLPILRALVGHIETLEQVQARFTVPVDLSDTDGLSLLDKLSRLRDRESKAVASLSVKLRLSTQSRYTPQAAATAARAHGEPRPWETGPDLLAKPKGHHQ